MRKAIYRSALVICAGVFMWGCSNPVDAQGQAPPVVIQGGTLIDGNGGAPVENSVVVIEGGRITAVGEQGQVQIPADAQIIDAAGKYLVPGLIDAKANWNWQYGEPYLVWGVTSAIVSGGRNNRGYANRDAINNGVFHAPQLFQTGVTIAGSGPNNDRRDNYVPGAGNRVATSPEQAVEHVQLMHETGTDFITFQNGDGPYEIHAAAAAEAQRLGLAIAFRAMGPQVRAREVCEMGDGIVYVHTGNAGAQMAADESAWATYTGLPPDAYSDMDDGKMAQMVEHLVGCNAYLEPDLMATARGFHRNWARVQREDAEFYSDPVLMSYYPAISAAGVLENVKSPETYLDPDALARRAAGFANQVRFLKAFVDAGGKIVAASDVPQAPPGLGMHQEMAAFVEDVGLTPMQGIQSGTIWVAEGFNIDDDLGTIEEGKLGDIIILNSNPLDDFLNMRDIDTVLKAGEVVDRTYHTDYDGWLFANDRITDDRNLIEARDWVGAVKDAQWRANARNGGWGNTGGIDSEIAPTPAIEAISPHTVPRGSGETTVNLTGFNFVTASQVMVDGAAVPTQVVSRTEIVATIPASIMAQAGNLDIVVQNPEPVRRPYWGDTSNVAHILVPFEYTQYLPNEGW